MILPVILAGGFGSRLWPLSRSQYPKQFLPLMDQELTLFQETILRLPAELCHPPIIVCHEDHRFLVAEQLRLIHRSASAIILEPAAKNTAGAIALACFWAEQHFKHTPLLILPADHSIQDKDAFSKVIQQSAEIACQDYLVTFGIQPTYPETGYGYIRKGKAISPNTFSIQNFAEKPDESTAKTYLESEEYYWNSGLFAFKGDTYLNTLRTHAPAIYDAAKVAISQTVNDLDFLRPDAEAYQQCPSDSIDYAVMEHTDKGVVIPYHGDWSDVGSWQALWQVQNKDSSGNICKGDTLIKDTQNCYIDSRHRLVATLGVKDLVVVETPDATLIAHQSQSQSVKDIVNTLTADNRIEVEGHTTTYRPWGHFKELSQGNGYLVKTITVLPGRSLSLQMHHHRSEHWIIVKGQAAVTCDKANFTLKENESTYIPIKTKHRLANPFDDILELIEVQVGQHLDESDIIRYEDDYGRQEKVEVSHENNA